VTVPVGKRLVDNYQVIELPDDKSNTVTNSALALLARIDFMEAHLAKTENNDKNSTDHKKYLNKSNMMIN